VGCRRGIGAGLAAGLATDGWDLVLSYWHPADERVGHEFDPGDPEDLADELRAAGRRVELLPADLEDPETPEGLVQGAVESVGPLSALVMSHCEGVGSGVAGHDRGEL
jgi:3-oxoacyl-[acyl-carrier protein] reductase